VRARVQQEGVLLGHRMDITGHVYGQLTVIEDVGRNKDGRVIWLCLCSCGQKVQVIGKSLRSGNTKSCGCLLREATTKRNTTHGFSTRNGVHPVYRVWAGIQRRCSNPRSGDYKYYGGRGVSYDPKWKTFEGFWEDMGDTWKEGLSIDRIDVNGNYCKENCRWATQKDQTRNKRNNRLLEYKGETRCVSEWCELLGLKRDKIKDRINKLKWPVEKAFETL